jgi:transcriptional regulator with PAS, ATPase and Fis domain
MTEIYRVAERLANKSDVTMLVLGESGTGKSFLCKTLHEMSSRRDKPFIEIGCSSIPEHLIESELFGYEKGSFTDAKVTKKGLVEVAEGGTVFLDEVGDMPYPMQSKLLDLIEERKFRRIGGLGSINADIRIFAATNRNLYDLVQEQKFRLDLYYRLNVVTLEMPPLRERPEDIPLLVQHYLKCYAEKYRCACKGITPRALNALQKHSWPGNIRELKNLLEKLVILARCEQLDVDDLPVTFLENRELIEMPRNPHPQPSFGQSETRSQGTLSLKALEEEHIRTALKRAEGNQRKAAKLLEITRDTLRYRLKKLGIDSSQYTE